MYLHKTNVYFKNTLNDISRLTKKDVAEIEKDYYVTIVLKGIHERCPEAIFKGGTSLSKAFGVINRFSEDVDICLPLGKSTQSYRKKLIAAVLETMQETGLEVSEKNKSRVQKTGMYNCIQGNFNTLRSKNSTSIIVPYVKVEIAHITPEFPTEQMTIKSYIHDYMKHIGNENAIQKYSLQPFKMDVVHYERTFVDKLFAIVDYYIIKKVHRYSRHVYDLYMLINKIQWARYDKKLEIQALYVQVKELRKKNGQRCPSSFENVDMKKMYIEIFDSDYYKKDYYENTYGVIYNGHKVEYEECKRVIMLFVNSGIIF